MECRVIFRPWRQDDRPTWWARVQHELTGPLDREGRDAVRQQALQTGLARFALVVQDGATVSTYLLVKADSDEEAEEVSAAVVEAAHREAGHGLLGRRMLRAATPYHAGTWYGAPGSTAAS